jgi:hypothetical protein
MFADRRSSHGASPDFPMSSAGLMESCLQRSTCTLSTEGALGTWTYCRNDSSKNVVPGEAKAVPPRTPDDSFVNDSIEDPAVPSNATCLSAMTIRSNTVSIYPSKEADRINRNSVCLMREAWSKM